MRSGAPRIEDTPKSARINMKVSSMAPRIDGVISGRVISFKVRQGEAPEMRAASSMEAEIRFMVGSTTIKDTAYRYIDMMKIIPPRL